MNESEREEIIRNSESQLSAKKEQEGLEMEAMQGE